MTIEWDEGAIRRIEQQAVAAVRKRAAQAVAGLSCPDHGKPIQFVPATEKDAIGRIEGCCEKAAQLGQEALSRALD